MSTSSETTEKRIWEEEYKITSYLVNLRGRAGLYAILNLIQDVGWMHAIAAQVRLPANLAWVFTRQKLVMSQWPKWNETISIRTWLRPPESAAFILRDYEIILNGQVIGTCTSTFAVIDTQTRKIAAQEWSEYEQLFRTGTALPHHPVKIPYREDAQDLTVFEVRNSDIDLNNHVNNTKYAKWILDSISIDTLRAGVDLLEYEVNFLAEARSGDRVTVQSCAEEKLEGQSDSATALIQFQGVRVSDKKTIFTAKLRVR
ncbi:acyl-[acyl-carrier-protein] thioesterase [Pseudobdellovibrio exovorus]|uniref:Acyl-ACP thioesterase n=1 Tax=Pseudobdellovibrio exovorus JSS TaxID=1184267 RepID=M4VN84_9BACT|nr:acyl-ACP thioesterase domain-containing protein [Pseudobdellovibrio exovorus]AGH94539.1 hypothetical protein A11Q_319 [Pseudobdellovibrio exovorus JSS]